MIELLLWAVGLFFGFVVLVFVLTWWPILRAWSAALHEQQAQMLADREGRP